MTAEVRKFCRLVFHFQEFIFLKDFYVVTSNEAYTPNGGWTEVPVLVCDDALR